MKWLLALHIISVICWFAGLFYLPRLFVYHTNTKSKEALDKFRIMEHKLFYYIMNPSLVLTIASGFLLVPYYFQQPNAHHLWLAIKVFLVMVLVVFHISCGVYIHKFKHHKPTPSEKFFRIYNEIPTILLIAIVLLAVLQPSF